MRNKTQEIISFFSIKTILMEAGTILSKPVNPSENEILLYEEINEMIPVNDIDDVNSRCIIQSFKTQCISKFDLSYPGILKMIIIKDLDDILVSVSYNDNIKTKDDSIFINTISISDDKEYIPIGDIRDYVTSNGFSIRIPNNEDTPTMYKYELYF